MRMLILDALRRLLERALKPFRPPRSPELLALRELARRAHELAEKRTVYERACSRIIDNVSGPGMTHEQARQFSRLVQANSGEPMQETCFKHTDREPRFFVSETTLYLCDECAEVQREAGKVVRPLRGILFGFPVVDAEEDGILDARIIG